MNIVSGSHIMQATTDYNNFKKTVVDRFRNDHSVDKKVQRIFNKNSSPSDEDKLKETDEAEKLMNILLRKQE